ncbi:MAG: Ldh family oxidoreductase [Proteobacteria bacterium]|nr:Ldh family oxidoreductase [Pseudomonadota bacterium]
MTPPRGTVNDDAIRIPAATVGRQIEAVFRAWDMAGELIAPTVAAMVETDLRGVDSHGIAMLPRYYELLREGVINMRPAIRLVREGPVTGLLDADGAIGHPVSLRAVDLAIDKARAAGVGVVGVVDSNHFGAAGVYALRAARAGMVGLATTNAWARAVVPTRARVPMFGTNPIALAAPAREHLPFVLDMATSTVAVGKINLCWYNDRPVPDGWVLDEDGRSIADPARAREYIYQREEGGLTPLGGTPALSSHKGYGLAAAVEILAGTLVGATYIGVSRGRRSAKGRYNIGHLFMAIDPGAFREAGAFEADLDAMIDALHRTPPLEAGEPVLVAGDPEWTSTAERERSGIPIPRRLAERIRWVAGDCGAAYVLE